MELMIASASFVLGVVITSIFIRVILPLLIRWIPILKIKIKHNPYNNYPKYVKLVDPNKTSERGCEMRLRNNDAEDGFEYWRDAGIWGIGASWEYKGIWPFRKSILRVNTDDLEHLEHLRKDIFIEISKEEWKQGNKGYV